MLDKKTSAIVLPTSFGEKFIGNNDNYNYPKIFKSFIHAIFIPLLLLFIFSPKIALIYYIAVLILYCTVFRSNAKYFFGVSSIFTMIIILFIIPN